MVSVGNKEEKCRYRKKYHYKAFSDKDTTVCGGRKTSIPIKGW